MRSPYTKLAAHRLLPFAKLILSTREMKNCIQVTYLANGGKCSTFLSKRAFITTNTNARAQRSLDIEVVERHGKDFVVKSHNSGNFYTVRPWHPDPKQRCECGHVHFTGDDCKHQVAVRNRVNERAKIRAKAMPKGFTFTPLVLTNLQPMVSYFNRERVQIWRLHGSDSGNGCLALVDTKWNAMIAVGRGYEEMEAKRDQYIGLGLAAA